MVRYRQTFDKTCNDVTKKVGTLLHEDWTSAANITCFLLGKVVRIELRVRRRDESANT